VWIFISLTATHHSLLHHLNIKNVFLNGVLDEEIYMKQPLDFIAQEELEKMYRLKKSLYRLKE